MKRLFLLPLFSILFAYSLYAQLPGIDSTFGRYGAAWRNVYPSDDQALAIALRPDGRALVVGRTTIDTMPRMGVWQLLPDGKLDLDFHWNGRGALGPIVGDGAAHAIALDAQGRAVIAGYFTQPPYGAQFAVVRLLPDGRYDTSFGNTGWVTTDFNSGSDDQANAVLIQPDGKILAAGFARKGKDADFALARYLEDGSLDPGFGDAGLVISKMDTLADIIRDIALQANGKILICGTSVDPLGFNYPAYFALGRFLSNGQPDPLFAGNGKVRIDIGADEESDIAKSLALTSTGQIVLGGYSGVSLASTVTVARFTPNGLLDPSFDTDGVVQTTIFPNSGNFCNDLLVQPDNTILLGGMAENVDFKDAFVIKLEANGALSTGFGQNGKVLRSLSPKDDNAYGLARRPDGRILLAGDMRREGEFFTDAAVMQFLPNGAVDTAFGQDGATLQDVGTSADHGLDLSVSTDGSIIAAGWSQEDLTSNNPAALLAKWNGQGIPDSTFGQQGLLVRNSTPRYDAWLAVVTQSDGKVVAGGKKGDEVILARFTPQGVLDPLFGLNGEIKLNLPGFSSLNTLIEQADGSLLATGEWNDLINLKSFLYKISSEGKVDATFGNAGVVLSDQSDVYWTDVVSLPDGSILAGGISYLGIQDATVSKYTAEGKIDPSFGSSGTVNFSKVVYPNALQVQADGKLLLAGFNKVMRLLPNGDLDLSFGDDGIAIIQTEDLPECSDVQVQRDGKIIVSGLLSASNPNPAGHYAIICRLNSDGGLDPSWGEKGILLLRGIQAYRCTFDDNGNILAVGSIDNGERSDIVVYRLLRGAYVGTADRPDAASQWINVFPNPVSDLVTVQYDLLNEQPVSIQLCDASGRRLHRLLEGAARSAGLHDERLILPAGLPGGFYTLLIQTPKGHTAVQIVVVQP